jgi:two-component system phosphate regulon sensor histidine kinase PhoR
VNRLFIRLTISILIVVGLNLIGLAYFIGETLLDELTEKGKLYISASFILSFLILAFLIYHITRKTFAPVQEITELIRDLNKGHYWRRIHSQDHRDLLYELMEQTNHLAKQLQEATEEQLINENRLQALIRHMASGLMFINQKGRIVITNTRVREILNWQNDYDKALYYEAPIPTEMIDMIRDTFTDDKEIKKQITIESGLRRIDVELSVAPVKNMEDKVTGLVLVFHDITDLKKLERMRADFVANVSHELKTPLTSIKGFSETLLEGAMHSEEHLTQFLEIIRKESDRLHRLIQDLLHLSHIEQGKFQLHWENVSLADVLENVVLLVEAKAAEKRISLSLEGAEQEGKMKGDRDRVQQIFLNLVSNALQYTPEEGEVTIKIAKWEQKGWKVSVKDTGVGV